MVSTGRSALSPEVLKVELCDVCLRGRRTVVDVRRSDRWVESRNNVGGSVALG